MKKSVCLLLVLLLLLILAGVKNEDNNVVGNIFQNINISLPQIPERHIYNENSYEKNLLLQFLHDEIPLEISPGEYTYFSEYSENGGLYYYIVDMDGDG